MSDDIKIEFDALIFDINRSIRYHNHRRRYFERIHTVSTFLSALGGSATAVSVLGKIGTGYSVTFALLVAFFSILSLVVGAIQASRQHHDFARKYIKLLGEIVSAEKTVDNFYIYDQKRLEIEADEPPILKVLDSFCHNELIRSGEYDESEYVDISWIQNIFKQIIDINSQKLAKRKLVKKKL